MNENSKIYIAGHRGMVGSAILRALESRGFKNIIYKTRSELDLINQAEVKSFFKEEKPEYVFVAAARVGGILANDQFSADFLYENLMIESNLIHSAYENNIKKLLFLGSSCIYPKFAKQPMVEDDLLTGKLEPTNEAYAIAKIAGIKLCDMYRKQYGSNFISAMPTNLYGMNDNFHIKNSHVLPALIRKVHEAKVNKTAFVEIWGSGKPLREFLYVDDLAEACLFLMDNYNEAGHINVGSGVECSIRELADTIKNIVGYDGDFKFDSTKPDGTPRKLMDVTKINQLGWKALTPLEKGIELTYNWFLQNINDIKI
jgi:GDP-L-fucose synthase